MLKYCKYVFFTQQYQGNIRIVPRLYQTRNGNGKRNEGGNTWSVRAPRVLAFFFDPLNSTITRQAISNRNGNINEGGNTWSDRDPRVPPTCYRSSCQCHYFGIAIPDNSLVLLYQILLCYTRQYFAILDIIL